MPRGGGICPGEQPRAQRLQPRCPGRNKQMEAPQRREHLTGTRYLCKQRVNTQPDRADKPPRPAGGFSSLLRGEEEEDSFRMTIENLKARARQRWEGCTGLPCFARHSAALLLGHRRPAPLPEASPCPHAQQGGNPLFLPGCSTRRAGGITQGVRCPHGAPPLLAGQPSPVAQPQQIVLLRGCWGSPRKPHPCPGWAAGNQIEEV